MGQAGEAGFFFTKELRRRTSSKAQISKTQTGQRFHCSSCSSKICARFDTRVDLMNLSSLLSSANSARFWVPELLLTVSCLQAAPVISIL